MKKTIILVSLLLMSMSQSTRKAKLYVIGDSTASIYAENVYPRTGWAQVLQDFFLADSVEVVDKAASGRSSRSFFDEGRWTPIKNDLKPGDYVIIQFGHNDEKTSDASRGTLPGSTFEHFLSIYIDDAIAKGATPILATPINRNSWNSDNRTVTNSHITADGDYPQAIRDLAAEKKIDLIDATALTKTFMEEIGKDSCTTLFMNIARGEFPNFPDGNSDNTHLRESGARAVAQLVVNDIIDQKIRPIGTWIKGGLTSVRQSPKTTGHSTTAMTIFNRTGNREYHTFDLGGRVVTAVNRPATGVLIRYNTTTGRRMSPTTINVH